MNANLPPLKLATSIEDQVSLLASRNLLIQDHIYAQSMLAKINYYRFTGYLLPFKTSQGTYTAGTTFEQIIELYEFDSKLRFHILSLCEQIEIQTRSHLSHFLAMKYPSEPACYRTRGHFAFPTEASFNQFIEKWDENLARSSEIFIKHHGTRYGGRFPVWVAVEALTFANLSIFFSNFLPADKRSVARAYRLKTPHLLQNWLHVFSVLRNKCAHFSRLYYTLLDKDVALSDNAKSLNLNAKKLYALIFSAKYLVQDRTFWNIWVDELESLLKEYQTVLDLNILGFVPNWKFHLLSVPSDIH